MISCSRRITHRTVVSERPGCRAARYVEGCSGEEALAIWRKLLEDDSSKAQLVYAAKVQMVKFILMVRCLEQILTFSVHECVQPRTVGWSWSHYSQVSVQVGCYQRWSL